jgi:hypothetical protein
MVNSRRMRWTGHIARVEYVRYAYKIRSETLKGSDHLEDLSVFGRINMKMDIKETGWNGVD